LTLTSGWYGLAAAKQYQEMHPGCALAIIDYTKTIGGIWSKDRIYPGLKSNNLYGNYQYPDFPMTPATFGVWPGQHYPGTAIHAYFSAYTERFDLVRSLHLQTKVISAEHLEQGGWILKTRKMSGESMELKGSDDEGIYDNEIFAKRMVMATGMMSEPFMPKIEGQETFGRPLFHFKDFHSHEFTLDPTKYQRVTVFGGTKSAWDAVYEYASRGIQVDWVMRASGHGPCWMAPPFVTPFKKWIELLVSRWTPSTSPRFSIRKIEPVSN
jgi:cation diffusion facilitator CzcD-associated flavoprotein CzcO